MIRTVSRKLNKYKSEHEFIELSMRVYVMDDGWRKKNTPYVRSDSNGVVDDYPDKLNEGTKMRCFMVKMLVMTGYGNEKKYDPGTDQFEETPEYFFGKSYLELVSYMREHNYERVDNEMYSLNFYEL